MATATKTDSTTTAAVTQGIQQFNDELLGSVRKGGQFAIDTMATWLETVSKLSPVPPASLPFVPSRDEVREFVSASFAASEKVLVLQRELAERFVDSLVPAASAR